MLNATLLPSRGVLAVFYLYRKYFILIFIIYFIDITVAGHTSQTWKSHSGNFR